MIQDPSLYPPPPVPPGLKPGTVAYIRVRVAAYDLKVVGGLWKPGDGEPRGPEPRAVASVLVRPIDKDGKDVGGEVFTFLSESVVAGAVVVREMKA